VGGYLMDSWNQKPQEGVPKIFFAKKEFLVGHLENLSNWMERECHRDNG
jgi:hypothetical protein